MKICILCYRSNPYSGGQGIYLKYLSEELLRQGHEVYAVVGPPYYNDFKATRVVPISNNEYCVKKKLRIINNKSPFDILNPLNFYEYLSSRIGVFPEIATFGFRAFNAVKKLHREVGLDIIHDNQSLGYGLLLFKSLSIPVVATIHHPLTIDLKVVLERVPTFIKKIKSRLFYPVMMQSYVAKRMNHIITVSQAAQSDIYHDFGVHIEKQTVVYNGIDRSIFKPIKSVDKIKGKLLFVGNVEDGKKGFIYLLKALPLIDTELNLYVIDGGAPHRKITKTLIDKLNITDRVVFIGTSTVEELVRHYNEAELVIVPSVYEGFGFPAAEAMSCGTPVIVSDGGALPEVVGDAGVIVPHRDHMEIASAINSLYNDRERMNLLAAAGLYRVKEIFDWQKVVNEIVSVYDKII